MNKLVCTGKDNIIDTPDNVTVMGEIQGNGNRITIAGHKTPQKIAVRIFGDNNCIEIGEKALLSALLVEMGYPRWSANETRLTIGEGFSIGSQGRFVLPNSGNVVQIGDDCMFSGQVNIRAGEFPHLIFDLEDGRYLDVSDGIFIGNHVWVGEGAYINKSVTLPDDCIVGARSVVTKRFAERNCVIAGNPARIAKRSVQWVANEWLLGDYPGLKRSYSKTPLHRTNTHYRILAREAAAAKAAEDAQVPPGETVAVSDHAAAIDASDQD